MAWDSTAQELAVNVIARVESNGAYDAINTRDAITIGLMQWWGTRAAALLNKIRTDNPGTWAWIGGALDQLDADLDAHPDTSRWWTTRYLDGAEATALKPILRANHVAQHETISDDIDDYRAAAERLGMDPDGNTQAVIYFCVMYHQTPARAVDIVNTARPASDIDRLYAVSMNDGTFSQYRTRYTTARDLIKSGDAGTLIDLNDDDAPGSDGGGGDDATGDGGTSDALERVKSTVTYVESVGGQLHLHLAAGGVAIAYSDGRGRFLVSAYRAGVGEDVEETDADNTPFDPDAPTDPDTDATGPANTTRSKLVAWGKDKLGDWRYTNGPARVNPLVTGATDCSGFVKAMYLAVTGIQLGQITSQQYTQGRRVATGTGSLDMSQLRVGDLIYFKWSNPAWQSPKVTDHVEMYIGGGKSIGHPGPGMGPRILDLAPQIANAQRWWAQRHIEDD